MVEARCVGATYRGFEQIMIGRAPRDALVITPRICGICSTAHLYAALALEDAWGITLPANAIHIRNASLMAACAICGKAFCFLPRISATTAMRDRRRARRPSPLSPRSAGRIGKPCVIPAGSSKSSLCWPDNGRIPRT